MIKKTDNVNVETFINSCPLLEVPKFQRDYAWEAEEIRDFVEDWKSLVVEHAKSGIEVSHFFGGLVTIESSKNGSKIYEVVDGQQRLTTLFLATWKLRKAFLVVGERAKRENDKLYETRAENIANALANVLFNRVQNEYGDEELHMRLNLSRQDRDFFRGLIYDLQPTPERASHRRLMEAADSIWPWIDSDILSDTKDLTTTFERLVNLKSRLYQDCYLLHISSSNRGQAYGLFAVLNDRGKTLSEGDQLRWFTMDLVDSNGKSGDSLKNIEEAWEEILAGKTTEIAGFLEAYYPSYTAGRVKKTTAAKQYREEFFKKVPPLSLKAVQEVEDRVLDIRSHMEAYRKLVDGSWPYENSSIPQWTQKRLERLIKDLKHTLSIPLLLSAQNELSEDKFARIVLVLEKFVFRYITIVGAKPGTLYPTYYKHAQNIRKSGNSYNLENLIDALRNLAEKNAPDNKFEEELRGEKLLYMPVSQRRITRYFLTTLNDHCQWTGLDVKVASKPDQMSVIDPGQVNLEHIYPQNAKAADIDPELEKLKHDVGNLTFWAPQDNQKATNKPFQSKKDAYKSSSAKMTKALGDLAGDWNENEVVKRRDELVRVALEVFRF